MLTIDQKRQEVLIGKSFKNNGITLKIDGEDAEYLKIQKVYYDLLNIVINEEVDDNILDTDIDDLLIKMKSHYIYIMEI